MSFLAHLRRWGAVYSLILTAITGGIFLYQYFAPPIARIELWQLEGSSPLFDTKSSIYLAPSASRLPNLYSTSLVYRNTGDLTVPNVTDRRRISNPDAILAIRAESETVDRSQIKAAVRQGTLAIDIDFLKPDESASITLITGSPVKLAGQFRMRNAEAKLVDPQKQIASLARLSYVVLGLLFLLVSFQSFALYRATTKRPDVIDGGTF